MDPHFYMNINFQDYILHSMDSALRGYSSGKRGIV